MALHLEALRRQVVHGTWARVNRIHAITDIAVEIVMVMMGVTMSQRAGHFVPCGLPWQIDAHDLIAIQQILQLPVDRGQAQPGYLALRKFADFLGHQRPAALPQCAEDGVALACLAFHAPILLQMH